LFAFESFLQKRFCFFPFVYLTKARAQNCESAARQYLWFLAPVRSFLTIATRFSSDRAQFRAGFIVKIVQRTELSNSVRAMAAE
jgi:hypothetical protein